MLELKNLVKTYKTKGGQTVHALDDVSVKFPEKGMVFLLGKSGSGKSTLLNVAGGLDRPDSGEIIIKGKNSKDFSSSDFDSYRNTFIGFIFQEYNILNEFSIEANISLALQLQGKKSDRKEVEKYLNQVGLQGLGKRKPNTLSGGQKQRVAIARALIKNPKIIMADEPTGALDSNTGKQVFDTLKELSKDKLVIVVSHDRDFAEIYADRIIELKDGKIISDVSKEIVTAKKATENVNLLNDNTIVINDTSIITEADVKEIVKALKKKKGEALISSGQRDLTLVKQAIKIGSDNSSQVFNDTTDIVVDEYDPKNTKFIRSHLPVKRAFKMGASYLKIKVGKLLITSLLIIASLSMFGIVAPFMLYDSNYSISQALENSLYDSETIQKSYEYKNSYYRLDLSTGEVTLDYDYKSDTNTLFGVSEINSMNNNNVNHKYAGIFTFGRSGQDVLTFSNYTGKTDYYAYNSLFGFVEGASSYMSNIGATLNGTYPENYDEIAISNYTYEMIKSNSTTINSETDLIGTNVLVTLRGNYGSTNAQLKVTGIYNLGTIPSDFNELNEENSTLNTKEYENLKDKFEDYITLSYYRLGYVSNDFYDHYLESLYHEYTNSYKQAIYASGLSLSIYDNSSYDVDSNYGQSVVNEVLYNYYSDYYNAYDLSGQKITNVTFGVQNAYVSKDEYLNHLTTDYYKYLEKARSLTYSYFYDESVYAYFSIDENRTQLTDAIDRYYNYANNRFKNYETGYDKNVDFNLIKTTMDTYYYKTMYGRYVSDLAVEYKNYLDYIQSDKYTAFTDAYNNMISDYPYKKSKIEAVASFLEEDNSNLYDYNLVCRVYSQYYSDAYRSGVETIYNNYQLNHSITNDERTYLENIYNNYIRFDTPLSLDLSDVNSDFEVSSFYLYYKDSRGNHGTLNVLGYIDNLDYGYVVSNEFLKSHSTYDETVQVSKQVADYVKPVDARYEFAITLTDYTQDQIANLLTKTSTYEYKMTNNTYRGVLIYIELISLLKKIFLITGIVVGVFAALLLINFISTSISNKIREIGILRAVGARGSDLFKIFFSESGLLSFICVIIAIVISAVTCTTLNNQMYQEIGIKMLDFNIICIGMIFAGAILISILGTFLPVFIASKKQPVESIRTI